MKEITLNNQNYILVKVPDDAYDFRYKIMPDKQKQLVGTVKDEDGNIGTCYINENPQGKIIGKISDILKDEDVCKGLVHHVSDFNKEPRYNGYFAPFPYSKATDSFLSYLQSIDLDITKQYLLIKKI